MNNADAIQQRHAPSHERGRDWRDDAACLKADPELFFPASRNDKDQIERAKRICRMCPVIMECLQNALSEGTQFGIAGGLTEDERRALRRKHIPPHKYRDVIARSLSQV